MSLILPSDYHSIDIIKRNEDIRWIPEYEVGDYQLTKPMRIGILNLMPLGHQYELNILNSIGFTNFDVHPVWFKLKTHNYTTWPEGYVDKYYTNYEKIDDVEALDGFIITGTPIEHLDFEDVTYWKEIIEIINDTRERFPSTLGLCWAGMAMAYLLGVKKVVYERKMFGVFKLQNQTLNHPIMETTENKFFCPQSRNAGMDNYGIEKAEQNGDLTALAYSEEVGYPIYETPDHKQIVHLGHPEYNSSRLAYEAERDKDNANVPPVKNFDFGNPVNVWKNHRHSFFQKWLNYCNENSNIQK